MVQDHDSMPSIPEELYNLTQLAEVTLAAGKLSTTNLSEITEYIKSEKIKLEDINVNATKTATATATSESLSIIEPQDQSQDKDFKKFKYRHKPENIDKHFQTITDNQKFIIVKPIPINATTSKPPPLIPMKPQNDSVNFFSSSDDDSNYYSHKIFDRKKSRRSTFSDNSTIRFDELSWSSIPSSCDELNYSASGRKSGGDISYDDVDNDSGSNGGGINSKINVCSENGIKLIKDNSNSSLDDEHICPDCGKKYSTSSNLARHRQTHRSLLDKKARRCPYCEKVYVSMPAYSMHVRTHNQGCKCDHCGKCFSRPWLLQGHIRTHTGEKPFKCSTCNKAFADKSNLRAHIQTHSNTKPHICGRCGKSFALKSYLYKHEESSCMRNHLKHEKDRMNAVKSSASNNSIASLKMTTTKSTLASKILHKESQLQQQQQQIKDQQQMNNLMAAAQPFSDPQMIRNSPKTVSSWNSDQIEYSRHVVDEHKDEKSFTTLISPQMSQEEYDKYARISVIRAPISSISPISTTSTTTPSSAVSNYIDYHHHHHQQQQQHSIPTSTSNNVVQMNFYQENPVDFSPKNNFTHSTKTSPFELTSNYTMVA